MKKTIAVLFVAFILVSSVFAFNVKSIGVETGFGRHGGIFVCTDMEAAKNLDIYARLGYTGRFNFSTGLEYKVADIKISNMTVPFKPGLQLDFNFGGGFVFEALATACFSFEARPFTAFARPGFGLFATKGGTGFVWGLETGVAFML